MENTEKIKPKSPGRNLMESKRQAKEELKERYENDPEFRAALEELKPRETVPVKTKPQPPSYSPEEQARQELAAAFFEKLAQSQRDTLKEMEEAAENDPRVREIIAELLHRNALNRTG
ncbi:MAG: hypothetical protein LH606_13320 [Cytophagaceae bacterium]|nr:hypothetical protein [Cytophagaceae bacterium]